MRIIYIALILFLTAACHQFQVFAQGCSIDYEGASLIEKTGQAEIYSKPDGTRITKYSDRDEAVCPDGTKLTNYRNGRRIVQKPEGELIEFRTDGSISYTGKNQKRELSMKGKTPYGLEIKEETRIIKRRDFSVELVYSSALSDDVMDNYIKAFYTELAREIERWIYSQTVQAGSVRVLLSNCRFCVTGYCAGKKTPGIEIVFMGPSSQNKSVFFTREDILDKKKHADLAVGVVEEFFGK